MFKDRAPMALSGIAIYVLVLAALASCGKGEQLRSQYASMKESIEETRRELHTRYHNATEREQQQILADAGSAVWDTLMKKVFPAWEGTLWDFYGTSRTPGEGSIACGVFVVRCLQDVGFKIPDKMAAEPSENIIKNLTGKVNIARFPNAVPVDDVIRHVRGTGDGLYVVGLDDHVGFLINIKGKVIFCHAKPGHVVTSESASHPSRFTSSKYRVVGKMLDDEMMGKWLNGASFPIVYSYFL